MHAILSVTIGWFLAIGSGDAPAWPVDPAAISDIKPDEYVVFFPTYGVKAVGGRAWRLQVHGWVYETRADGMDAYLRAARALGASDTRLVKHSRVIDRVRPFLVDSETGKHLVAGIGRQRWSLAPSSAGGHFRGEIMLGVEGAEASARSDDGRRIHVPIDAVLQPEDGRGFAGRCDLIPDEGWSVISDIDDTIKTSDVLHAVEMVKNTFERPFRAVPGMAELYRRWAVAPGTAFHYVSSSPWQLYQALEDFRENAAFPRGVYHLRNFTWRWDGFTRMLGSPREHKLPEIKRILTDFPNRRFILVGDSGELDPEIYAELARQHSGRVIHILIREVSGRSAAHERYQRAFEGLPTRSWQVFHDAEEVRFDPTP